MIRDRPCEGCLLNVVDRGDGLRAHDAAEPVLGQLQKAIARRLDIRLAQTTQYTHFEREND